MLPLVDQKNVAPARAFANIVACDQLLAPPPAADHFQTKRKLEDAYSKYAWAWSAFMAVDHPQSHHALKSDAEKDALRLERGPLLAQRSREYLAILKRFEATQARKARERAKKEQRFKTEPEVVKAEQRKQSRLFANSWPEPFSFIVERFPLRPFVTNDLSLGTTVRPLNQAQGWSYIQYNSPIADHLLIVDYDAPGGVDIDLALGQSGLPSPAWICRSPGTPRGHLAWALDTPVCTSSAAKLKPMQYLARIEEGYRSALNGDRGFSGLLTKNPIADSWEVEWIDPTAHSLDDLAQHVQIDRYTSKSKSKAAEIEPYGLGRKVLAFEKARKWSYSAVSQYWGGRYEKWFEAVRSEIDEINGGFETPLPDAHCKSIAKSIAKWVWTRFTPLTKHQLVIETHKPAVQALRGARKGAKKREALMPQVIEQRAQGATQREIAAQFALPLMTVSDWLRRSS